MGRKEKEMLQEAIEQAVAAKRCVIIPDNGEGYLIRTYLNQFKIDDVDLEFEEDALKAVANKAIQLNTGARGLRAILEDLLLDMMYDIPSDKSIERVVVNADCITSKAKPQIIRKSKTQAETA